MKIFCFNKIYPFSANLGFLFSEVSGDLLTRYQHAFAAGFKAVEHPFPEVDLDKLLLLKKELNLEVSLVNIELDQQFKFGCAALNVDAFKEHLTNSINFAKKFDCKKIHLMSGKLEASPTDLHRETFMNNLRHAAPLLEAENMIGVIEPISTVPGYFLQDFKYSVDVLKAVNSKHIKLMADVFHLQMIQGNVMGSLKELFPYIGHVQIAQAPSRNEPNTPGDLDLKCIIEELENLGYDDYFGCEYAPLNTTKEGLKWVEEFGWKL
jgi:hydroxypyruvate isomerase